MSSNGRATTLGICLLIVNFAPPTVSQNGRSVVLSAYFPDTPKCTIKSGLRRTFACPYPGANFEIAEIIHRSAGVTSIQLEKTSKSGNKQNKSFVNQVLSDISNGAIFSDSVAWLVTPYRLANFQMSTIISYSSFYALVSDKQKQYDIHFMSGEAANYLEPFSLGVWMVFIAILVLLKIYSSFLKFMPISKLRPDHNVAGSLVVVVLFLGITTSLYKCQLLSRLLKTERRYTLNSFSDILTALETGRTRLVAVKGVGWLEDLMSSDRHKLSHANQRFQDVLVKYPPLPMAFSSEETHRIEKGDLIRMGSIDALLVHRAKSCALRILKLPDLGSLPNALIFRNTTSGKVLGAYDQAILSLHSMVWRIKERYSDNERFSHSRKCEHRNPPYQSFSIEKLVGPFGMLILGCVLGVLVLGLERWAPWRRDQLYRTISK